MKKESEEICGHIPAKDPRADEWHQRRVLIRRELRRHQLSDSVLRVAEIILDMSLGQGLESVLIPNRDCFRELTGIGNPHVSEAIKQLKEMRIIRVSSSNGVPTFAIREDPDTDGLSPFNWRVQPRMSLREMKRSIDLIREYNNLPPLPENRTLEAIANFKNGPSTKKTASSRPENGRPDGHTGGHTDELPHLF